MLRPLLGVHNAHDASNPNGLSSMTNRSCRADARLAWLVLAPILSAWAPLTCAQTQTAPLTAELAFTATAVKSDGPSTLGTQGTELVTSTSAGLTVHRAAGSVRADGNVRLTEVHYVRGQLSDRLVPTGNMLLRAQSAGSGLGLDLNASAQQVKPTQANQPVTPIQRAGTYNNAQLQLSPYWTRDLGSTATVSARMNRAVVQNWAYGDSGTAVPADTRVNDDSFTLNRRPTPLGYGVEWRGQRTATRDAAAPAYGERNARAVLSLAPSAQWLLSAFAGQSVTHSGAVSRSDPTHGLRLAWQASPRSKLNAEVEQRFWGRADKLDFTESGERLSFSLNRIRDATTLAASQLSAASNGAANAAAAAGNPGTGPNATTPGLSPGVRDGVVQRDAIAGTTTYLLTRRDTIGATGGFIRTAPLTLQPGSVGGARTRDHYLSLNFDHRLSRTTVWNTNLRWDRSWNIPLGAAGATLSRDFTWKTGLNSTLNPNTSATIGIQREITHRTSLPDTSDTQMYLGLNHRL